MKNRPVRINESREHFVPPPHPGDLQLNDAGELIRLENDGSESVLVDAQSLEPVLFDELPTETVAASHQPPTPTPPRRLSLNTTPTPSSAVQATQDSAEEGRSFARDHMSAARRERLEQRDTHRTATPPSAAPGPVAASTSAADGQALARSNMTPEQRERLEARDRRRNT